MHSYTIYFIVLCISSALYVLFNRLISHKISDKWFDVSVKLEISLLMLIGVSFIVWFPVVAGSDRIHHGDLYAVDAVVIFALTVCIII